MSKELISAHNWFYNECGFIWKSDKERLGQLEYWQVLKRKWFKSAFKGDCEDAALTIMNKMLESGVSKDELYIVRCATELCPTYRDYDHAILLHIKNDKWYFSDNRYQQYPACDLRSLLSYKLYDMISVDNFRGIGCPKLIETYG